MRYSIENKYIFILGIKATSDEGFVIYGAKSDNNYQGSFYPFVTKFDADGGFTGTKNVIEDFYTIKSYPNPSDGPLILEIYGISGSMDIRVFDIAGKNVYVQTDVTEGETMLDLSGLINGSYVYKVYRGSVELYSGKWIKR